jgi:hypothetical protein
MSGESDNEPVDSGIHLPQNRFEQGSAVLTGAAAAALALINPVVGIVAAGLAPLVASRLNELYASRLERAVRGLEDRGVDLDAAVREGPNAALKADTFRDFMNASLETDSREKAAFLLHLAEFGLNSSVRMETLFARRVIRTVARIDELEMIILGVLVRLDRNLDGVQLATLAQQTNVSDVDILSSGLAVLQSEGLVTQRPNAKDLFRVSDYGQGVLKHLRDALNERISPEAGSTA